MCRGANSVRKPTGKRQEADAADAADRQRQEADRQRALAEAAEARAKGEAGRARTAEQEMRGRCMPPTAT